MFHQSYSNIEDILFVFKSSLTTGIRGFAECRPLCRVPFVGHSAKKALPSAALGKVRLSATSLFTECWTLGTGRHSAKTRLSSVKHSAKEALGKGPSATVPKLTAVSLCRVPGVGTRQRTLCNTPGVTVTKTWAWHHKHWHCICLIHLECIH
jgi:hypothetical protein